MNSAAEDIKSLFRRFGGSPEQYQEVVRETGVGKSLGKWAMLSQLDLNHLLPVPGVKRMVKVAQSRPMTEPLANQFATEPRPPTMRTRAADVPGFAHSVIPAVPATTMTSSEMVDKASPTPGMSVSFASRLGTSHVNMPQQAVTKTAGMPMRRLFSHEAVSSDPPTRHNEPAQRVAVKVAPKSNDSSGFAPSIQPPSSSLNSSKVNVLSPLAGRLRQTAQETQPEQQTHQMPLANKNTLTGLFGRLSTMTRVGHEASVFRRK